MTSGMFLRQCALLACAMALVLMCCSVQAFLTAEPKYMTPYTCGNTEIYFRCDATMAENAVDPTLCHGDMVLTPSGMLKTDGYNPCEHTTCLGVQCPAGSNLVQGYRPMPSSPLINVIITGNDADAADRCSCISDFTRPYQTVPIASVQPDSPEAQQNDPRCEGLMCESPLQFVFSTDGTYYGCVCCDKPSDAISVIPIPATATFQGCGVQEPVIDPTKPSRKPVSASKFLDAARGMCPEVVPGIINLGDNQLLQTMDNYCCVQRGVEMCGGDILDMVGPAVVQCEYRTEDRQFQCCGVIGDNMSAVTTMGAVCDPGYLMDGDSSSDAALRPPSSAALLTASAAAAAVLLMSFF